MFENVIKRLQSEINMFAEFINDKTGIITTSSKVDYKNKVVEYEQAIATLKGGTQAASTNTSANCERCKK